MNDWTFWLTWVIFALTYAGLALGQSARAAHGPGRHRPGRRHADVGHRRADARRRPSAASRSTSRRCSCCSA